MDEQGRHSISFLLRLWQIASGDELGWRASLEALGDERLAFASIDELCVYLRWHAGLPPEWNDSRTGKGEST
jgi:hypothetical protein